jgi:hypothetical protein
LDKQISHVVDQIIELSVEKKATSENESGFLVGDRVTEQMVKPWKKPRVGTVVKITKCFVYVKVDGDKSVEAGQKRKHNSFWKLVQ